jgi:hypothetical protein
MPTIRFADPSMKLSGDEIRQLIDQWRKEIDLKNTSREKVDELIIEKARAYGLTISKRRT